MRLRLLAGLVAGSILAGCNDPVHAEDQIELDVGASRTLVVPTDTVVLAAALHNSSGSTLPVSRPCGRPFRFELLNSAGSVVFDSNGPDFTCATDSTTSALPLRAGQTLNSNLGLIGLQSDGSPLPEGQYLLRATVVVAGIARRSPTVRITVLSSGAA